MLIVTTDHVPGKDIEVLGLVKGSNADAVVAVRYATSGIMQGAAEVMATAQLLNSDKLFVTKALNRMTTPERTALKAALCLDRRCRPGV